MKTLQTSKVTTSMPQFIAKAVQLCTSVYQSLSVSCSKKANVLRFVLSQGQEYSKQVCQVS